MAPRRLRAGAYVLSAMVLLGTLVACATTARITDVYSALDGAGARKRNVFFTDSKEIHCVVEMGIGRAGATVSVYVRQIQAYNFDTDAYVFTDRGEAEAENSPTPQEGLQTLDISLTPTAPDGTEASGSPFPPGRFVCEASLDGELQRTTTFNVDFPPCPDVQIIPGTLCFGFYKNNLQCPRYGLTTTDPTQCTCTILKGWQCE